MPTTRKLKEITEATPEPSRWGVDAQDIMTVLGVGLVAVGAWETWAPLGWIVPGLAMVWYGLPSRPGFIAREERS
jgi:fatty acid desaturase